MKILKLLYAVMVVTACALGMHDAQSAELSASGKREVEQLLSRLAASDCQFNRNGSWYTPTEARDHLNRKFQYALDKKLLSSAEDFISVIGSKSSSSGEAYAVKCGRATAPQPSADWLSSELRKLRASGAAAGK
jgi:Family of unknown function (DUF5329)